MVLRECLRRLAPTQPAAASALRRVRDADADQRTIRTSELDVTWDPVGDTNLAKLESVGALRESTWAAFSGGTGDLYDQAVIRPRWSRGVMDAVSQAIREAVAHRQGFTSVTHLLAGLLLNRGNDACQLLKVSGVAPEELLDSTRHTKAIGRGSRPWTPSLDLLRVDGATAGQSFGWRWARIVLRLAIARPSGGPVMFALRNETNRQCVRLGHEQVRPVHQLLAVMALDHQMLARDIPFKAGLIPQNRAGEVLRSHNASYERLIENAALLDTGSTGTARISPPTNSAGPHWHQDAIDVDERAQRLARDGGRRFPGTGHLLAAICGDPSGDVSELFRRIHLDLATIGVEVSRTLTGPD
jgi:hypothetical protein